MYLGEEEWEKEHSEDLKRLGSLSLIATVNLDSGEEIGGSCSPPMKVYDGDWNI